MRKNIIALIIIIQIIFTSILIISFISQYASGGPLEPTVELSLVEDQKTAHYSGEYAYVNFDGIVNVTMNPVTRVIVSLSAEDSWGSAVASPNTLLFTNNSKKSFRVEVRVPPGEKYNSEGILRVYGNWQMYPGTLSGSCDPVQGKIIVGQYFNFSISGDKDIIETERGSEAELELSITNNGNNIDTFSIEIENMEDLSASGFELELSSSKIEIPKGLDETVKITVNTPSDKNVFDKNEIRIKVYLDQGVDQNVPAQEHTFVIKLKDKNSISVSDFSIILIIIFMVVVVTSVLVWRWKKNRIKV